MAALQVVSLLSDLNGNDVMSIFKLAKGFTRLLDGDNLKAVPDDMNEAHSRPQASRRIRLLSKSKVAINDHIVVADMIKVNYKAGMSKRGVWSTPKIMPAINYNAPTFTVS